MKEKIKKIYKKIETLQNSKMIAYVTSDRKNMEMQIGADVVDIFGRHLDKIGKSKKISLILYTLGGNTMAAWNIVNLIREYCEEFEIIVPRKARSAGTILCLGTNKIILTHQSTLGPIDPSIISPLGNKVNINGLDMNIPTSVESVKAYFNLAKHELGINKSKDLIKAFLKLSDTLNPLLMGDVYRSQGQIKMIAEKLLVYQNCKKKQKRSIINFLCSDSGSHDYAINFKEAKQLGLNVELANDKLNNLINEWYDLVCEDLQLNNPYNPQLELARQPNSLPLEYKYIRSIVDSLNFGRDQFVSKGKLSYSFSNQHNAMGMPVQTINDHRVYEGWEKYVS